MELVSLVLIVSSSVVISDVFEAVVPGGMFKNSKNIKKFPNSINLFLEISILELKFPVDSMNASNLGGNPLTW